MSLQTPIFVSNIITTTASLHAIYSNCSACDINGNIYSSLVDFYGAIQKTDISGTTTLFLQLNSGNTPGSGTQYPTGMCFDISGNLFYLVYGNNFIYKITDFNTPNPVKFNLTDVGLPSAPSRIIIDNTNNNKFYISSLNQTGGIYSIISYDNSIPSFNTVFNLSSPTNYGSSYGLAQDFSGSNLYIGVSGGKILKGALSGSSVSVWLTLPELLNVTSLTFISNNTLIAQPVINTTGYGYIINIDPSTGIGTASLYYDVTPVSIIGGLGLCKSSIPFLYGLSSSPGLLSSAIYKIAVYDPIQNTNYEISTGQDLSLIFRPLLGTAGSDTGFEYYDLTTSSYKDISQLFELYLSGSIPATTYISDLSPFNGKDLNLIFQGI